jgi:hypothetical protein
MRQQSNPELNPSSLRQYHAHCSQMLILLKEEINAYTVFMIMITSHSDSTSYFRRVESCANNKLPEFETKLLNYLVR